MDQGHSLVQTDFEKTADVVAIVAAVYGHQGLDEFRILKENNEIVLIRWPIRNSYFENQPKRSYSPLPSESWPPSWPPGPPWPPGPGTNEL